MFNSIIASLVLVASLAMGSVASAKLQFAQETVNAVYITAEGKQVTAGEAVIAITKGTKVLKCTEQEAKETKSGVSMKAKR